MELGMQVEFELLFVSIFRWNDSFESPVAPPIYKQHHDNFIRWVKSAIT